MESPQPDTPPTPLELPSPQQPESQVAPKTPETEGEKELYFHYEDAFPDSSAPTDRNEIIVHTDNPMRRNNYTTSTSVSTASYFEIPASIVESTPVPIIEPVPTPQIIPTTIPVTQSEQTTTLPIKPPKLIFVVPYRDREEQQEFFDDHMRTRVLRDVPPEDYLFLYAHQMDDRPFNRGAMKNIGFLAGKAMFPNDYRKITFVFNDVDTMPYVKNFLNYETVPGKVKHFYGFKHALGGIVSMTGGDFEAVNGFPNSFGWAGEDNMLQKRVLAANFEIDRSQFYPILDKRILQNKDGLEKLINKTEFELIVNGTKEGVAEIGNLVYSYDPVKGFVNITQFSVGHAYRPDEDQIYNLTEHGNSVWKAFNKPLNIIQNRRRRGDAWRELMNGNVSLHQIQQQQRQQLQQQQEEQYQHYQHRQQLTGQAYNKMRFVAPPPNANIGQMFKIA
jgi:hypothetical protein